jgi:proteic killer suppression protein
MIGSFAGGAGSDAARLFRGEAAALLPADFHPAARRGLRMLDAAAGFADLGRAAGGAPRVRAEGPDGPRAGQHSLPLAASGPAGAPASAPAGEWRIYFRWHGGAFDVEIE